MCFDMQEYMIIGTNLWYCVVPENIHTPTMEGIGNSDGEGVCMIDFVSRGALIQCGFQKSFLTY